LRRLLGFLAVLSLLLTLSATPASAQLITKFDLRSARLLQKGTAVDLTFTVACGLEPPLSDFHGATYTVTARLDQRVGKTTVTNIPGASISGDCPYSHTTPFPVTIRVYAPDSKKHKFRQKPARVTGTLQVCDEWGGCQTSTSTKVIRLSKRVR
jgi:hypothetical protein